VSTLFANVYVYEGKGLYLVAQKGKYEERIIVFCKVGKEVLEL